jgi:glycine/D-amino acid oxidase-like deaminating enzyme
VNAHDVLVIGAGFTGSMIAARLAEAGAKVAVFDAQPVASGATRRAIGLVTPSLNANHIDMTLKGAATLSRLAAQHGVLPRLCSAVHLASQPDQSDELRSRIDADVIPNGYGGGLSVLNSALIDLPLLTVKLLQHPEITVHPNIEIQSLEWKRGVLHALADGYTIRADTVVLATNAYAGLLSPYLAEAIRFVPGVTWSSRPLGDDGAVQLSLPLGSPLIIDDGKMIVARGSDNRLRISAWDWSAGIGSRTADVTAQIQRWLHQQQPELVAQTDQWVSGVTTASHDGLPLIGRPVGEGNVVYAIGAGPYGPAWGQYIADRVADLVRHS